MNHEMLRKALESLPDYPSGPKMTFEEFVDTYVTRRDHRVTAPGMPGDFVKSSKRKSRRERGRRKALRCVGGAA